MYDCIRHQFYYTCSNSIHPPYPLHRILCLELLVDAFGGGIVFDQPKEKSVGLFLDIGKVGTELASGLQVGIEDGPMLPEIVQSALAPDANGALFFGW